MTLRSVWTADTAVGRGMLGGSEWHATFVESHVLVETPEGWKLALGHASMLPPYFGVEPDFQEHGGMKFAKVRGGSPGGKVGFKAGDVLIEYGRRKIDNYVD